MKKRKSRPVYAFAAVRDGEINAWWIEPEAKRIRAEPHWPQALKNGWRVRKVKITLA